MSENEVRAGGAYVEIGGKKSKLDKVLDEARKNVADFGAFVKNVGAGMQEVGGKMAMIGGGIAAAMLTAVKSTADLAEKTANLRTKTGMSLQGIAAIQSAAEDSGVAVESMGAAVRGMQLNFAEGGKEAQAALGRLGLKMADLKSMSPEQAMGAIADQLLLITDQNERAALGAAVFGRAYKDVVPVLAEGSAGLNRAAADARKFGTAFTEEGLEAALEADRAFDQMAKSLKGVAVSIGDALIPVIVPLIDGITAAIVQTRQWIEVNEPLMQSIFAIGTAVLAAGGAFIAMGAMIAAALSPAVQIAGILAAIGMTALAVTDTLGVTAIGFGELFNSIRVDGTGLATWLSGFFLWIAKAWNTVTSNLGILWHGFTTVFSNALSVMVGAFSAGMGQIIKLMSYFGSTADAMVNGAIAAFNSLQKVITIDFRSNIGGTLNEAGESMTQFGAGMVNQAVADFGQGRTRQDRKVFDRDRENARIEKEIEGIFGKDPQDGSRKAFDIDTSKAKAGFEKIGQGILDALNVSVGGFKMPEFAMPTGPGPFGGQGGASPLGEKPNLEKMDFSSVGTFSGIAAGQLAGKGIFDLQLTEMRETKEATKEVARNTANGGAAYAN